MVVTLPIATIKRILDRVSSLPEQASEFILVEALARIRIRRRRRDEQSNTDDKAATKAPREHRLRAGESQRRQDFNRRRQTRGASWTLRLHHIARLVSRYAARFRRRRCGSRRYGCAGVILHPKAGSYCSRQVGGIFTSPSSRAAYRSALYSPRCSIGTTMLTGLTAYPRPAPSC